MYVDIVFEGKITKDLPLFNLGEYGQVLGFTVRNDDKSLYNLSTATVLIYAKELNNLNKYLINGNNCTLVTPASGTCQYTISSMDLTKPGSYECYLLIAKTSFTEKVSLGFLNIF